MAYKLFSDGYVECGDCGQPLGYVTEPAKDPDADVLANSSYWEHQTACPAAGAPEVPEVDVAAVNAYVESVYQNFQAQQA